MKRFYFYALLSLISYSVSAQYIDFNFEKDPELLYWAKMNKIRKMTTSYDLYSPYSIDSSTVEIMFSEQGFLEEQRIYLQEIWGNDTFQPSGTDSTFQDFYGVWHKVYKSADKTMERQFAFDTDSTLMYDLKMEGIILPYWVRFLLQKTKYNSSAEISAQYNFDYHLYNEMTPFFDTTRFTKYETNNNVLHLYSFYRKYKNGYINHRVEDVRESYVENEYFKLSDTLDMNSFNKDKAFNFIISQFKKLYGTSDYKFLFKYYVTAYDQAIRNGETKYYFIPSANNPIQLIWTYDFSKEPHIRFVSIEYNKTGRLEKYFLFVDSNIANQPELLEWNQYNKAGQITEYGNKYNRTNYYYDGTFLKSISYYVNASRSKIKRYKLIKQEDYSKSIRFQFIGNEGKEVKIIYKDRPYIFKVEYWK